TLRELKRQNPYPRLAQETARLCEGLSAAARAAGLPHQVAAVGSMFTLFFNPDPVRNYTIAARSDTARFSRYFWGMIERGIYLPCSQFEANFVSAAHSPADIDATIAAARDVLAKVG
ncbi:MAG: aspartate aminotransferase family protein, partial [Planctomycetaceae bacterium]